jgi:hypothetical protein
LAFGTLVLYEVIRPLASWALHAKCSGKGEKKTRRVGVKTSFGLRAEHSRAVKERVLLKVEEDNNRQRERWFGMKREGESET